MSLKNVTRSLAVGIAAGAALIAAQSVAAADDRGSVQGVVNDASGQPVAGAFVKLKNADRRLTFLVVSQGQGRFEAKDLPVGKYTVQGIGAGYESDWFSDVSVSTGDAAKVGLSLTNKQGAMLQPAWPKRLPEDLVAKVSKDAKDLPDGEGKALVAEKCTVCHDVRRIGVKRSPRPDWEFTVHRMRGIMATQSMPDLTDAQAKTIVDYVSSNFKPMQPYDANSRLPRTLLTGKAMNYKVVTYDLVNSYAEPHDVATDPKGNAWVAERAGKVGRFDPKTLEFTERNTPPGPAPADRQRLGNPQIDAKGIMWMPDGPNQRWLSYDTNTDKFLAFAWPRGKGPAGGNTMALHPDGTVWATGAGKEARKLDPATGIFSFYEAPSAKEHKDPGAYGMAVAGDGSVWFAEDNVDLMARVDPVTGKVDEYKIPYAGKAFPRRMNSDANGDLWVALWNAGKLMKIDHKTRAMTIYTPPTPNGGNYSVIVDKKNGYIWVSEHQVDKVSRFDPKTEEWVEFPLPEAESDPRRIDIDPTNPNRVYFSGNTASRVGFVEYLPQ
jgi:streptogramin lyase/mono/diheme cytochrome c family protein